MYQYVSEIYEQIEAATSTKEKIELLVKYKDHKDFINTLINVFHPGVKFHFEKIPEYKKLSGPVDYGFTTYNEAMRKIYLFIVDDPRASQNLTQKQRDNLLIQILESLPEKEALAYSNMMLKKTGVKGLTKGLVKQAFPNLIPN